MNLIFKERLNDLIANRVDLGKIVYTNEKISDNHIENSIYDVYERPSIYKQNAFNDIKNDCQAVHGHGLHVTSYCHMTENEPENFNAKYYKTYINFNERNEIK